MPVFTKAPVAGQGLTTTSTPTFSSLTVNGKAVISDSGANTFIGIDAGKVANVGTGTNIGIGYEALKALTTAYDNVIVGAQSAKRLISGSYNTMFGSYSGEFTTGSENTFIGSWVGWSGGGSSNTYIGYMAGTGDAATNDPVTDTYGILIGYYPNRSVPKATALTNYIGIGKNTLIDKSNQVKIGNTSIVETQLYGTILSSFINNIDSDLNEIDSFTWAGGYGLLIIACTTDAAVGVWRLEGTTFVISSVNALFTNTKDNVGTYNVYFESGALKIQNKVNNNKVIKASFHGVGV